MQLKTLGRTDLKVTDICLGTMTWGSQNTEAEGHAQIALARDAGITFMDTAELYAVPGSPETSGTHEEIIGNWFATHKDRDRWVLASKIGGGGSPHIRNGHRADGASIREAVEASLRRLKTDYLDLYQIHWASRGHYHFEGYWSYAPERQDTADVLANLTDMLETLGDLVKAGKIRHVGVSNETTWGIAQWLRIAEQQGLPRLVSVQNEYNLLRRMFDHDLAELSHHEQVGPLAYSPLAGACSPQVPERRHPDRQPQALPAGLLALQRMVDAATSDYHELARAHGLDPGADGPRLRALAPLRHLDLIGATSTEQFDARPRRTRGQALARSAGGIDAIHRRNPRPL